MSRLGRLVDAAALVGAIGAVAATAHTVTNLRALRAPAVDPSPARELVSVLLPMRDEADRVEPCLRAVLGQVGVRELEVIVLDDGSTDDTLERVQRIAATDSRIRVITGDPLPGGWLGKPHACAQLAEAANGSVLVFVDADVTLEPHAVAATVELLRSADLDAVSPYPRQVSVTAAERLVQPLLQWSWLTFLPLGAAERSPRESLVAANGQLFAVDADAYRRCGGHRAIRTEVLDDIALMRAIKRAGGRGVVADGTALASCRMYDGWSELRPGYTKSLWSAFGGPTGAAATTGMLALLYVVPPVALALRGSRAGAVGTLAGIAGRALVARRVGGRVWPDSLAHPASVATFGWLTAQSVRGRREGSLSWKGRSLP